MNKQILVAAFVLSAGSVGAQVYKIDTAFTTDIGAGNKPASCSFSGSVNNTYGLNHNRAFFFLLGEDITVPTGQTWNLDTVILYGYQTGSTTTSTLNYLSLEIRQGSVTGPVVFGDTTTSRLISSSWTGIYRVDKNALTGTTRPIMQMKIKLTPTKSLSAGTYWMIWGCKGSGTGGVFCPPKVNPGRVNPSGQNAMQHSNGVWHAALDTITGSATVNVGFNYMLKGPQRPAGITTGPGTTALLQQNQPNPFPGSTTIVFTLPEAGYVKLEVHNVAGQRVATLVDRRMPAGTTETVFNADGLPAGIYYYRLRTEASILTKKMEVIK